MGKRNPQPQYDDACEVTLAMAQATIAAAMRDAGFTYAEMARRIGTNRSRIPQLLSRDGMTLRTLARCLAACGKEVRFLVVPAKTYIRSTTEKTR